MIPLSFDSGSELLNMWSSNVADVWVIHVGSVISGRSECVNGVFKKLDVALWEVWFSRLIFNRLILLVGLWVLERVVSKRYILKNSCSVVSDTD